MTITTTPSPDFPTIDASELPGVTGAWGRCMRSTTVRPGDTLTAIAKRFHMPLNQLIALNGQISNPNLIHPGDRIYTGHRWRGFFR